MDANHVFDPSQTPTFGIGAGIALSLGLLKLHFILEVVMLGNLCTNCRAIILSF